MKKKDCDICDVKEIPWNDTIKIDGKNYCNNCFNTHFTDQNLLKNKLVEKELDPTICSSCAKDFDELELKKISIYPICFDCETTLKNKTFPIWVKCFLVGILVLVIVSFIWNWKFYSAYMDIKKSNDFFAKANYAEASKYMNAASKKVPEVEDLVTISAFYTGIDLLVKDKSSEALKEFEKCKDKLPDGYNIHTLILEAQIGSCYDNKDYNGYLNASKEFLALDSTLPLSLTYVASAYACLYAEKGNDEDKQNAILYLSKAKQIDSSSKDMLGYYNMIEYRLDSRRIIKREDFFKEFPNGWTKK